MLLKPSTFEDVKGDVEERIKRLKGGGGGKEGGYQGFKVYIADERIMKDIAGFQISRGALACGVKPRGREGGEFLSLLRGRDKRAGFRVVAMDKISDTSNLGSIIRTCAAFGVDAVLLSGDSCDAWYRRSVRVSMGAVFKIPVYRTEDIRGTLEGCGREGVETYATTLGEEAVGLEDLGVERDLGKAWCMVLGNEGAGVSPAVVGACQHKVKIQMRNGVDSLSVQIAAAVGIHWFVTHEGRGLT